MKIGDRIRITSDSPMGVFDPKCWSVEESRLTSRLWFDEDKTVTKGDEGKIIEHDHTGQGGWWIVDIDGYAVPLHEGTMEVVLPEVVKVPTDSKVVELRLVLTIEDVSSIDERKLKDQVYDVMGEVARELIQDGTIHDYRWENTP